MDDKPPPSRRSSGHSDKSKKSGRKKKKNKHRDRKQSAEETNSDSALETGGDKEPVHLPAIDNDFLVALPKRTESSSPGLNSTSTYMDDAQSRNRNKVDKSTNRKNGTLSRPSPSTSKSLSSISVGTRKTSSSSSSNIRSQDEYLEKCVSDIFERHGQSSALSVRTSGSGSSRATTEDGRGSSELENEVDNVSASFDESLRWDNPCSNPEEEAERIRVYKMNRRKRYLMDIVKQRRDKEGVLKFAVELATYDGR